MIIKRSFMSGLLLGVAVLAACSNGGGDAVSTSTSSESSSTTTSAPVTTASTTTTTVPPTTTSPPTTTVAPTVAPPTPATTAGDPSEEEAKEEVLATLDAFWVEIDACFEAPTDCDTDAVVDKYSLPDSYVRVWFPSKVKDYADKNRRRTQSDRNESSIGLFNAAGPGVAFVAQCMTDRSVVVQGVSASTEIVNDRVGHYVYLWSWVQNDGQWKVAQLEIESVEPGESQGCPFPES